MNWFTRTGISSFTEEKKKQLASEDSCCGHVEADPNLAVVIRREMDSMGPVSSHCACAACETLMQQEEDNEQCTCRDCLGTFPRSQVVMWRWYDFYAAQGDEPICVCDSCRKLPKHQERVRKDREDYEYEFGSGD